MNTHIRMILVLALLVMAAPLANADSSAPSHSCRKPTKPSEIKSQQEADKFNDAVAKYRSCIEEFVRQQEEAAMNHRRAASQAIGEWNDFVTTEMKQ